MTDFSRRDKYIQRYQATVSNKDEFGHYEKTRLVYQRYSTEEVKRSNAFLKTSRLPSKLPKKTPLRFK